MTRRPDNRGRGRRRALLIATDTYEDPEFTKLVAPAGDAEALAEVLGDPGLGQFDVTKVFNGLADEIERALKSFLAESEPDDLVLVYFSCHGVKDVQNRYYLAAKDSEADRLAQTGLNPRAILVQLDECDARTQVVILDCCFSGAFRRGLVSRGARSKVDLPVHLSGRGRIILTSSTSFQYSYEEGSGALPGLRPRSVFTSVLLDGIRNGLADRDRDGYVSISELYDFVTETLTRNRDPQTPELYSDGRGSVWIARNPYHRPSAPLLVLPGGSTVAGTMANALNAFPHAVEARDLFLATLDKLRHLLRTHEGSVLWRDMVAAVDPPGRPTRLVDAAYDVLHALDSLNGDAVLVLAVTDLCDALLAQVADAASSEAVDELFSVVIDYLELFGTLLTRFERYLQLRRLTLAARTFVEAVARTIRRTATEPVGQGEDQVPDQLAALATVAEDLRALAHVLRGLGGRGPVPQLVEELAAAVRRSRFVDADGATALRALAEGLRVVFGHVRDFLEEADDRDLQTFVSGVVEDAVAELTRPLDEEACAKAVHRRTGRLLTNVKDASDVREMLAALRDLREAVSELHGSPLEPHDVTEITSDLVTQVSGLAAGIDESRTEIIAQLRAEARESLDGGTPTGSGPSA
ncbi:MULTISPECIES: caspase family protein [unclassified Streptomyces]|uniref:caspase family protein n=1 Tax=unclassified Streptomyces TaxID=2593676 RepID=UPI00278AA748|nr:caspase family protein [Streptomyces sp. DSM 40167]MDQ0407397.1 hypothetical protein [Streptomyces sp. DSM 40167]